MLLLKPSVEETGVSREIWYAIGCAAGLKMDLFATPLTVTALTDGEHNPGSLHARGLAVDLRTHDLATAEEAEHFYGALKFQLEPLGFDVVWEGGVGATPFTTGAHVHVEFQPKPGESFIHRAS